MEGLSRLRWIPRAASLAALMIVTGCTTLGPYRTAGAGAGAEDALQAHAWTLPECPSQAATPQAGLLTGALVATGVDLLLDRVAGALAAAAAADRDGLAWSGTDARYLHFGRATNAAGNAEPLAVHAGCVLVALTDRSGAHPGRWCTAHDAAPAESGAFAAACGSAGRALLAAAGDEPSHGGGSDAARIAPSLPRLYAEIRLLPSRDGAAVRPAIVNLHYPVALQSRASATRDLAFTLQLRLPEQARGANVFVLLRGLEPGKAHYDADDLASDGALWTVATAYQGRKLAPADIGAGLGAVNIMSEVRETGDTNRFLQALAASFAATRSEYEKALQ